MAPSGQRQRAPMRLIPAVPRIFETRKTAKEPETAHKEACATQEQGAAAENIEKSDTPPSTATTGTIPEATDWASLAAEENTLDTPTSTPTAEPEPESETAFIDTPKAEATVNGRSNGEKREDLSDGLHALASRDESGDYASRHRVQERSETVINDHHTRQSRQIPPFVPPIHAHQPHVPQWTHYPEHAYPPGLGPISSHPERRIAFGHFGTHFEGDSGSSAHQTPQTSSRLGQTNSRSGASRSGHGNFASDSVIIPRLSSIEQANSTLLMSEMDDEPPPVVIVEMLPDMFEKRNRDESLSALRDDAFAEGAPELILKVTVEDGPEEVSRTCRIARSVCKRSPILTRCLREAPETAEVKIRTKYVSARSFYAVVGFLYGKPLLEPNCAELAQRYTLVPRAPLEFMITAELLGATLAQEYSSELFLASRGWQTLAMHLEFCLENFIEGEKDWPPEFPAPIKIVGSSQSKIKVLEDSIRCLIYEVSNTAFRFINYAEHLPELRGGFKDRPAPVLLPQHHAVSSHTRQLSEIQLGNLDRIGDRRRQVISSILLSLPLAVLQHTLSCITRLDVISAVIREREARRQFAVAQAAEFCGINRDPKLPAHAIYEERIHSSLQDSNKMIISARRPQDADSS